MTMAPPSDVGSRDDKAKSPHLPSEFVDAHHHFLDTKNNDFQSFLGSLVPNTVYVAQDYHTHVVTPLAEVGVRLVGSVHVECMPDDALKEIEWVASMKDSTVSAIVASCDLTSPSINQDLALLKKASPKVRGVRWILDCIGPYAPNTATHIGTTRHDGVDYLRGNDGCPIAAFERGFALLAQHELSFDLQCAPVQLVQAAELCARHPGVNVCIDHLGKPRTLLGPDTTSNSNTIPNQEELEVWRRNMAFMAALPQVHVKISMLGYVVPGWIRSPSRVELMKQLVRETVELFGANRCMVALNWYKDGAMSDADGLSDVGPDPVQFARYMSSFFHDYSEEDRQRLFAGTAREFYRF